MKKSVFGALQAFLHGRLISDTLKEWRDAYNQSGKGSATRRAHDISEIYDAAAPVPGAVVTNETREFLAGMRRIVHEAIEAAGGEVKISLTA